MTKLILDTTFYIGLALKGQFYLKLYDFLTVDKMAEFELLMSDALFHEIKAKLFDAALAQYIESYNQDKMILLLEKIKFTHTLINPVKQLELIPKLNDPQDLFLLELAQQEQAHYLLSNDKMVNKLRWYGNTKICKFHDFYRQVQESEDGNLYQ
jgi:putative PIN family toxin of toxin-antitoxin system